MLAAVALALVVMALAGCGGGGGTSPAAPSGGGGGTGTPTPTATVVVNPTSVSVSATTSDSAPSATIQVSFSTSTAGTYYGSYSSTDNGIASSSATANGSSDSINLTFKSPASLGVGTYQDTVTIEGCYDSACTEQVEGSPVQVAVTYTVTQAPPLIDSLAPTAAVAGASAFTLELDGSGFTRQSVVEWNGSPRPTTYVSPSQITAQISGSDIASPGYAAVTVSDQTPGVAPSNSVSFNIAGPTIAFLSPISATADAPGFTLTVDGSNFTSSSVVEWNGTPLATTYSSPTVVTAAVTAADLTSAGSIPVTVAVSAQSSAESSPYDFAVEPLAALAADSLSPSVIYAGGPEFYLTVLGQGFTASSVVQWNGSANTTSYVSTDELRALIPASDIAATGTATVTVQDSSQGETSSPLSITIEADPPSKDAVAFQITPEHSGAITFNSVSLPSTSSWSVDLGGSPSYALIADGRVFVTTQSPSGSELIALDGSTGATLWGPIAISGSANAAYDSGTVFVIAAPGFGPAQIQAYDAVTGTLEWTTALTGQYSFTSAPTAADGYVYTGGAGSGGTLYAVSEATGALTWTAEVANGDDSTPAVTADGVYVDYPCIADDFTPATGASVWQYDSGCDGGGGGTPVVANGVLFAPDGSGADGGPQLNAETGAVIGSFATDFPPAIGAQTGYFLQSGTLKAIDLSSNAIAWTFAGDGELTTSPILVNGYVFIGSSSGNLYALDAVTGEVVWKVTVGAAIPAGAGWDTGIPLSGLSAGDGLLIVPSGSTVTAYTISSNP